MAALAARARRKRERVWCSPGRRRTRAMATAIGEGLAPAPRSLAGRAVAEAIGGGAPLGRPDDYRRFRAHAHRGRRGDPGARPVRADRSGADRTGGPRAGSPACTAMQSLLAASVRHHGYAPLHAGTGRVGGDERGARDVGCAIAERGSEPQEMGRRARVGGSAAHQGCRPLAGIKPQKGRVIACMTHAGRNILVLTERQALHRWSRARRGSSAPTSASACSERDIASSGWTCSPITTPGP